MPKKKQQWWHGMQCVYCEKEADSEDHVPPRSMYAKGTPDLIRVPCCGDCRKKYTMHDELFKTLLVKAAGDINPVAKEHLLGSVARALERLVGLGPKIARQTVSADVVTESGLYTGQRGHAISITDEDWRRIRIVLIRIVRGLYYHLNHRKKRYDNRAYLIVDSQSEDGEKIQKNEAFMAAFHATKPFNIVDGNVCKAKIIGVKNSNDVQIWILEFYGRKRFVIIVNTMDRAKEHMKAKQGQYVSPSGIVLKP